MSAGQPLLDQACYIPLDKLPLVVQADAGAGVRLGALGRPLGIAPVAELVLPLEQGCAIVIVAGGAVVLARRAFGPIVGRRTETATEQGPHEQGEEHRFLGRGSHDYLAPVLRATAVIGRSER